MAHPEGRARSVWRMDVSVGFFSFTEVTDPRSHRAYNAWHQLDHMPEQYPLAGVVHGERWVCTPACRTARLVDGDLLAPVHYLTLYLMGEPVDETLAAFRALGERLRAQGRFHRRRRARLSGPFEVTAARAAPRVLVSDEAVAFRPNRGVYVVVREPAGPPGSAPGPAVAAAGGGDAPLHPLAAALLGGPGVAGVWTFASGERAERHGWRSGDSDVTLCFLDEEPLEVAPVLGSVVAASPPGGRTTVFAGPFETITPWCWDWFEPGVRPGR